jgi:hypothetical protein
MNELIKTMHEYQRKNGIKGQCLANTQYLYDSLTASIPGLPIKPLAVIAYRQVHKELGIKNGKMHIEVQHHLITHMVLQVEDYLLDASAEIADMDDVTYVGFDICKLLKKLKGEVNEAGLKDVLKKYLLFKSYAERMNSGELIVCDKAYYDKQDDYVQSYFRNTPKN